VKRYIQIHTCTYSLVRAARPSKPPSGRVVRALSYIVLGVEERYKQSRRAGMKC